MEKHVYKNTIMLEFNVSDGTQTDVAINILKIMAMLVYIKRAINMESVLRSEGSKYIVSILDTNKNSVKAKSDLEQLIKDVDDYYKNKLDETKERVIDEIKEELEENPKLMEGSFDNYEVRKYKENFYYANEHEGL